jgi:hypothetical protein
LEPHKKPECSLTVPQRAQLQDMIGVARKDPFYIHVHHQLKHYVEVTGKVKNWLGVPWTGRADVYVKKRFTVDYKTTAASSSAEFKYMADEFGWYKQGFIYMKIFQVPDHILFGITKGKPTQVFRLPLRKVIIEKHIDILKYIQEGIDFFRDEYGGSFQRFHDRHEV